MSSYRPHARAAFSVDLPSTDKRRPFITVCSCDSWGPCYATPCRTAIPTDAYDHHAHIQTSGVGYIMYEAAATREQLSSADYWRKTTQFVRPHCQIGFWSESPPYSMRSSRETCYVMKNTAVASIEATEAAASVVFHGSWLDKRCFNETRNNK